MNKTVGKIARIGITITLISLILCILLFGFLELFGCIIDVVNDGYFLHFIYKMIGEDMPFSNIVLQVLSENAIYMLLCIITSTIYIPIVITSVLTLIFIILQAKKTSKIEKLVLRADNISNNYKFQFVPAQKKKKGLVVKILIAVVLLLIVAICSIGKEFCDAILTMNTIDAIWSILNNILSNDFYSSFMNPILIYLFTILSICISIIAIVINYLIFALIQAACVFGTIATFTGGRTQEIYELEDILRQKSNFAKIREMEENDEVDELSQLF